MRNKVLRARGESGFRSEGAKTYEESWREEVLDEPELDSALSVT